MFFDTSIQLTMKHFYVWKILRDPIELNFILSYTVSYLFVYPSRGSSIYAKIHFTSKKKGDREKLKWRLNCLPF